MKPTIAITPLLVLLLFTTNGFSQFDTTKISMEAAKLMLDTVTVLQVFAKAEQSIDALSYDMEEFNLDKIHPHLRVIYDYYEVMRVWAAGLSLSRGKKAVSRVDKLQKKTELVHKYFDAGEMIMSEANLARLKHSLPKTRGYFQELHLQHGAGK